MNSLLNFFQNVNVSLGEKVLLGILLIFGIVLIVLFGKIDKYRRINKKLKSQLLKNGTE